MRFIVLAALLGLATAEISDLQRETVRELKQKIQAGKLDELRDVPEAEGTVLLDSAGIQKKPIEPTEKEYITEEQMEKKREIERQVRETFGDLDDLHDDVEEDMRDYNERVRDARGELKEDFRNFKESRREVREKWRAAWDNAERNVKRERGEPFDRVYLDNDQQVAQQFKDADEFERRKNEEFERDFRDYMEEVKHAKDQLRRKRDEDWKPQARKVHDDIDDLIREIEGRPPRRELPPQPAPPQNVTLVAETEIDFNQAKPLTLDEQTMFGCFAALLLAGVAFTVGKFTKKSSTDFEFATDEETAPKRESKKEIKKTLKNVLNKNNAKATLIK